MHELGLTVDARSADAVSERLADAGALAVTVADADAGGPDERPVFDEPGIDAGAGWKTARLIALFADEAAATAAAGLVAAHEPAARIASIEALDERDWVRQTQAQFGPIEVAPGFWIVPSWADVPAGAAEVVRLDPGLAFGTGSHPTTRLVLRRMVERRTAAPGRVAGDDDAAAPDWRRVLDYGCGSGILAIAAARLGARSVDAVDIDPAAVEATRRNAADNAVAVEAGDPSRAHGEYDLVVANILATPLKLLAPLLAGHVAPGGELLLAGILERQADELRAAYAPWLALDVAASDDGWILMQARRRR